MLPPNLDALRTSLIARTPRSVEDSALLAELETLGAASAPATSPPAAPTTRGVGPAADACPACGRPWPKR
jgi:hypothetical protein